jgi:hypothetical protein
MNVSQTPLIAVLLAVLAITAAWSERDPFWPIGYTPAPAVVPFTPAEQPVVLEPVAPPKPLLPTEKPVSDSEWAQARKALTITGFTKSTRPDTQEIRILALINRQTYTAGDTLTFVHDEIRFQWRVVDVTEKDIFLTPIKAERTSLKPSTAKPGTLKPSA